MIELCSKKGLVLCGSVLLGLCLLAIFLENYFAPTAKTLEFQGVIHRSPGGSFIANDSSSTCWLKEEFRVIEECRPCTSFEQRSEKVRICDVTGKRELVECLSSKVEVFKSCAVVSRNEARRFWDFEIVVGLVGALSTFYALRRMKSLSDEMKERINRQIAAGV